VTTFLIGFLGAFGDFAAGSTSCDSGSSTTRVSLIGAAVANLFGFSSSLRKEAKDKAFIEVDRKKIIYENKQKDTHESMRSKSSTSPSGAKVSSAIVL
jgi:hypothetical protein